MARFARISFLLAIMGLLLFPISGIESVAEGVSPFRLSGDGKLRMIDLFTGESLNIVYRNADGIYEDSALAAMEHTLRCHGKSENYPISLKLIELIDYLQDHFGAEEIQIVSGYRSPEYNSKISLYSSRVAHNSLHMKGLAVDIRLPGVSKHALGSYAASLKSGGVGVYAGSDFVHIDVGPIRRW